MRLINSIILGLLISSQAFAGLPPTTAKGQLDASKSVTFNLQAPNSQMTRVDGTTALIETGSANKLKDPGFEASTTSAWTASGGATTTTTTTAANLGSGAKSYDWDSNSASQTLTSTSVSVTSGDGLSGQNGAASCRFKAASGTATHTIQAYDGTNILGSSTITSSTSGYVRTSVNFPFPASGSVSLRVVSVASNEPEIFIDDCYLGLAEGFNTTMVTQVGPWTSCTMTGSWVSNTTYVCFYRRSGDTADFRVEVQTSGAPTAANLTLTLPNSLSIDTAKLP